MRTRKAALAALALVVALPFLPGSGATAVAAPTTTAGAPQDYTKVKGLSKPRFETLRETHLVEMKDGIKIYVEVVRPQASGRFGTILELSPYHGTLADRSGTRILPGPKDGMAGYFAPRGYAVVFADLRGTGRSQGCLDHMGPKDQSDAKEIVEWAAKQPWSNGRVGMTGHSYVGSTPQMAAAQNPKGLVTIVPSAGLAAMYHHEFQNGVPYYLQWAGPLFAYELLAIERHLPGEDNAGNDMQYFGCGATQSAAVTGEAYFSGAETEWHKERDFRKGATKADIPTFIVHGVNDNAARIAAADWFHERQRRGDKAWIGQWDHGSGCCPNTRACEPSVNRNCLGDQWTPALHAWFDKHLQQRKVDTGPPVELFLNGGGVYTSDVWPLPNAKELRFFPQIDGGLANSRDDESSASYIADARGFSREFDTGHVAWTSKPVSRDLLIAGIPEMHLVMSTTSPRIHVNATLYDVAPDGGTPDRIGRAGWAIQPELRNGTDKPTPVIPTEVMSMDLESMAQAHLLAKGHKLMLRIASSHPDKVPTFAEGAQVTIYFGGKDGTSFTIPVIVDPKLYKDPVL